MNRRSFFKELGRSLTESGKEIIYPLFEDDVKKIEHAADVLQGVTWQPLPSLSTGYEEQVVGGRLICFYYDGKKAVACGKECPDCHQIVQWVAYKEQLVCPGCGYSYSFRDEGGLLHLPHYTMAERDGTWWIALPAKEDGADA